jgi:hypothetical protein
MVDGYQPHLIKDPSINIQDEIDNAVNQLKSHIKAANSVTTADVNMQLYFNKIS